MKAVLDAPVVRGRSAGDPPPPPATGARRLLAEPEAVDAVGEALAALHGTDGAPGTVPVVLAATDYCVRAADAFAAHCDDSARRLRPSDSVALEASGLLQRFTALTGWQGPGYAIAEPDGDGAAALRFARGLVESGRAPSVYLCEVLRRADTGAFWAVATRVRQEPADPPGRRSTDAGDHPPAPAGPAHGLDPATSRRSAVLRASIRPSSPDPAEEQLP
ncbi:hypothetical protein EDD98_7616 [Streptomyces sp. PanSC19]|uniref:hypothetical protein n=1 Tax=Streptomyces sp. PanSC19 TaxID=1520455 RepID=UPI000F491C2B|nr:hypothetical protein [Streptomyces sp. PanSC19]ROQ23167.1 hypothetical protein EDD98_7616 [Streptomyces sp. PanSC19]